MLGVVVLVTIVMLTFLQDVSSLNFRIPKPLVICNVSDISFNVSQMRMPFGQPYIQLFPPVIPDHQLGIAYAPQITKCGSTAAGNMISRIAGVERVQLQSKTVKEASKLHDYTYVTFLRHPLKRALAGYHQVRHFICNIFVWPFFSLQLFNELGKHFFQQRVTLQTQTILFPSAFWKKSVKYFTVWVGSIIRLRQITFVGGIKRVSAPLLGAILT